MSRKAFVTRIFYKGGIFDNWTHIRTNSKLIPAIAGLYPATGDRTPAQKHFPPHGFRKVTVDLLGQPANLRLLGISPWRKFATDSPLLLPQRAAGKRGGPLPRAPPEVAGSTRSLFPEEIVTEIARQAQGTPRHRLKRKPRKRNVCRAPCRSSPRSCRCLPLSLVNFSFNPTCTVERFCLSPIFTSP